MLSTQKIILCATNQCLLVSFWRGEKCQSIQAYLNQAQGQATFRQYVAQHQSVPIYLMVDAVEEEYQMAVLPHVKGRARHEMLARKLSQFSRSSLYKTACFIRANQEKRKEDYFLFYALTNADFLQPWLPILQAEQARLVGVYALSMMSQKLIRQQSTLVIPQLLFCEQLSSGFRQTYLHQGSLRMSRLTPIESVLAVDLADFYIAEIEKMHLYLISQRLIDGEFILPVRLSVERGVGHAVTQTLNQHSMFACQVISFDSHAFSTAASRKYSELHHMRLLASGSHASNLAPAEITEIHRVKRMTSQLYVVTGMVALISSLVALYCYTLGNEANTKAKVLQKQTAALLEKHVEVNSHYPETAVSGHEMKVAVDIAEQLNQDSPLRLMQVVSDALENEPAIIINRMRWLQSHDAHVTDENSQLEKVVHDSEVSHIKELIPIGFVHAEVRPFLSDHRATTVVNRLVAKLRADARVSDVQMLQSMVNSDSTDFLEGNTNEITAAPLPSSFKLKIILHTIQAVR